MLSNLNIKIQFPCLDTGAQAWVQYFIWGFIRVLYIFKTTFVPLEIKFVIIQRIYPLVLDTRDKIWFSDLNVSSKPTCLNSLKFFLNSSPAVDLHFLNNLFLFWTPFSSLFLIITPSLSLSLSLSLYIYIYIYIHIYIYIYIYIYSLVIVGFTAGHPLLRFLCQSV